MDHQQGSSHLMPLADSLDLGECDGVGPYIISGDGDSYLDLFMDVGVVSFGYEDHCDPVHLPNYIQNNKREEAAAILCESSGMDRAFFSNSGTEAVEAMIKFARKAQSDSGRYLVYARDGEFHGRSYGSMSLSFTDAPYHKEGFGPFVEGFGSFWAVEDIDPNAAAVMITPGMLNKDYIEYNQEFMGQLQEYCHRNDILLLVDEVQTYLRLGMPWGFQLYGLNPDAICVAKGVAGGIPTGVTLVKESISRCIPKGSHFSTFGGNPASVNGIIRTAERASDDDFFKRLNRAGGLFAKALRSAIPGVVIRQRGLMISCDLPGDINMIQFRDECLRRHIIIGVFGPKGALKLTPPLNSYSPTLHAASFEVGEAWRACSR